MRSINNTYADMLGGMPFENDGFSGHFFDLARHFGRFPPNWRANASSEEATSRAVQVGQPIWWALCKFAKLPPSRDKFFVDRPDRSTPAAQTTWYRISVVPWSGRSTLMPFAVYCPLAMKPIGAILAPGCGLLGDNLTRPELEKIQQDGCCQTQPPGPLGASLLAACLRVQGRPHR